MPESSQVTKFYVEGHTAEGAPYGPVHVLTTPLEEGESRWHEANVWEEAEQVGEDVARELSPSEPS